MRHQVCGIHFEGRRDADDVPQGDVHLAALDVTDVGAVNPGALSEAFLGDGTTVAVAKLFASCSDSAAELLDLFATLLRVLHDPSIRPVRTR